MEPEKPKLVQLDSFSSVFEQTLSRTKTYLFGERHYSLQNLSENGFQWCLRLQDKEGLYPRTFTVPGQDTSASPVLLSVRPEVILRHRTIWDRIGGIVRLVPEAPAGDKGFDRKVFVDDVTGAGVGAALLASAEARSAVQSLLSTFDEVRLWGPKYPVALKQATFFPANRSRGPLVDAQMTFLLGKMDLLVQKMPVVEVQEPQVKVRSRSAKFVKACVVILLLTLGAAALAEHWYPTSGNLHREEGFMLGLWGMIPAVPLALWMVRGSGAAMKHLLWILLLLCMASCFAGVAVGTAANVMTATTETMSLKRVKAVGDLRQDTCYIVLDPGDGRPVTESSIDCDVLLGTLPRSRSRGVMGWVY